MLAIAALMLVDALYQLGMHVRWRFWIAKQALAMHPTTQPSTQPATQPSKEPKRVGPPEIAAAIRGRNIFTAPPPSGHGMMLTGIIGNTALFSGRGGTVGIKEGESAQGVTVKSISDAYEVVIEFKGKPETMRLFGGQAGAGGGGPPMPPQPGVVVSGPREMHMQVSPGVPGSQAAPGAPVMMDSSEIPPEIRQRMERRRGR